MPKNASESPVSAPADEIVLSPSVAALVLRSAFVSGAISDVDDNQAELLVDQKTVRVYLKQKDQSHQKAYVLLPESVSFKVAPSE